MVNDGKVLRNIQMNKEQYVLRCHSYSITPPKTPDGRWRTNVMESNGKRKTLRTATYDGLIDKLYVFYSTDTKISQMSMQDLFFEWLPYKKCITNSSNTIRRHEQHWKKYFSTWSANLVSSYDKLELQKQCNLLIKEQNLSSKEWQNVKTILNGMFSYAFEKDYIKGNPMSDIKITVKFRQVNKKSGASETFQPCEREALMRYFDSAYAETGDSVYLALKLDFYLGLRVGELSALKWCDIIGLKDLHICREEVKNSISIDSGWKDVFEIVDHTKTHRDRIVPLVKTAIALLNDLRFKSGTVSNDDFIFVRDGIRITSRQITYALEKACKKCNIKTKRTHKIRKTVASTLNANGVPTDAIREMLGHSNLETTMGYIYNPLSERETYQLISKAL